VIGHLTELEVFELPNAQVTGVAASGEGSI